jgi:uridine kinase
MSSTFKKPPLNSGGLGASFTIGITGGTGSGKTFFLKCFLEHFTPDEVCLVSQDDYYIPVAHKMTKEENTLYNFDLPSTIDHRHFEDDIERLINGETILKKEYTFNNPDIVPRMLEIKPAPILIIEGLFILHFKKIAEKLDHKIFIEADDDVALQRRLKRDLAERGYSHDDVMYRWANHVTPAYNEYLLPYRDECDQIIANNSHEAEDILCVTEAISRELREKIL